MPADSVTNLPARDPLAALFPDESAPGSASTSRRRHLSRGRRRALVVLAIVAVVIAVVATRAVASGGPSYQSATIEDRAVGAVLEGVATLEPVSQAAIAFPTSGTVASVSVKVGDHVTAGETVAALDTTSLEQSLHEKEAALASAQLNLEKATSGQSVSLPNSSGSGGTGGSGNFSGNGSNATLKSTRTGGFSTGIVLTAATSDPELQQAQQAVLHAQHQVDVAIAASSAALDHATAVCAQVGVDPSTTTTTTTAPVSTTVPTDALAACQQALNEVLTAQKAVQTAQASLVDASQAYDDLLAERAANSGSGSTPPGGSTTGGASSGATGATGVTGATGATGASGAQGSGGFGGASTGAGSTPSSADLVAFQKAVDAAQDQVAVAQQALAQATIASPIEGTVVSVTLVPGDTVTAASTTANVVVKGGGGFQATSSVSVTKVAKVKVGQSATVLPDGAKTPLTGKVVAISAAPTSSSSSATATYRVVVALDATKETLQNGATADLTVLTASTKAGLAVPTSAITTTGTRHTVTVLDGDTTRVVTVQVGTMGPTWTVVKRGLTSGQQVVLADRTAALPSSATASASSSTSNTRIGTFPGGGSFPGGGNVPTFGGRTN